MDKPEEVDWRKVDRMEIYRLEERLEAEREERDRLEREVQTLRRERELLEERKEQETGSPVLDEGAIFRNKTRVTHPSCDLCQRFLR